MPEDPDWSATRDDVRRLGWVLGLVWLALAAFTTLAQRYLGWRLAVGLIGGAGVLFTLGLVLVAAGSLAATSFERRRALRMSNPWRTDPRLRGQFHPDHPDDVQVLVHDGGPRMTDRRPELVWARVTACENDVFTGRVLNRPEQLTSVSQGSVIRFIVPASGPPAVQARERYLAERADWIVHPCRSCGFSELFDAPSDLVRKVFPNMSPGDVVEAFTARCPLCGGAQIVQHSDAELDDDAP